MNASFKYPYDYSLSDNFLTVGKLVETQKFYHHLNHSFFGTGWNSHFLIWWIFKKLAFFGHFVWGKLMGHYRSEREGDKAVGAPWFTKCEEALPFPQNAVSFIRRLARFSSISREWSAIFARLKSRSVLRFGSVNKYKSHIVLHSQNMATLFKDPFQKINL